MRTPGGHVAARRARPRTPRRAHRAKQAWSKSLTSLAVLGADGARAAPPHPQPPQTAWVGAQRAGGSLRAHARRRQVPVHTAAQQQRILQGRPRPLPAGRLRVAGPGSGRQAGPGHADLRARLPLLADTALSSCAPCAPCAPPTHTALRLPIASPCPRKFHFYFSSSYEPRHEPGIRTCSAHRDAAADARATRRRRDGQARDGICGTSRVRRVLRRCGPPRAAQALVRLGDADPRAAAACAVGDGRRVGGRTRRGSARARMSSRSRRPGAGALLPGVPAPLALPALRGAPWRARRPRLVDRPHLPPPASVQRRRPTACMSTGHRRGAVQADCLSVLDCPVRGCPPYVPQAWRRAASRRRRRPTR